MTRVRIIELGGKRQVWEASSRTDDAGVAIARVVKKLFGPRASFWREQGIPYGRYGQIIRPHGDQHNGWSASTLTGRVRIDVEE